MAASLHAHYASAASKKISRRASLLPLAPTMVRYDAVRLSRRPPFFASGRRFHPMLPAGNTSLERLNQGRMPSPYRSFKARGLSAEFTMPPFRLKSRHPSAGMPPGALAAWLGPLLSIESHLVMPKDVPMANRIECYYVTYGARSAPIGLIFRVAPARSRSQRTPACVERRWFGRFLPQSLIASKAQKPWARIG